MTHVLVKWPSVDKWDVYPLKALADPAVGLRLMSEAGSFDELRGSVQNIYWQEGHKPAPAELLQIGKPHALERKRAKLALAARHIGDVGDTGDTSAAVEETETGPSPKVDIGRGVLVEQTVLTQLSMSCHGGPGKFARALLRHLFDDSELEGRCLFGKGSGEQKEALDPVRVNAII
ncbi:hypothetical protein MTO96_043520, partial [Rhipicephalus appendiculatus]